MIALKRYYKIKGYKIAPCKNCKREVKKKSRQCPYCGILNPTVQLKDVFQALAIVLVVMGIVTYFMNS